MIMNWTHPCVTLALAHIVEPTAQRRCAQEVYRLDRARSDWWRLCIDSGIIGQTFAGELTKSLALFVSILSAGIKIVTLADSQEYTADSMNDIGSLVMSLVSIARAQCPIITIIRDSRADPFFQTKMPSNMKNVKIKQEMQLYPLFLYLKVNYTQTISQIIYKRNKYMISNWYYCKKTHA